MKYKFLKIMPKGYHQYFYNRVRRMKRNGYVYDTDQSIIDNLFSYCGILYEKGKKKQFEKESLHIEGILKFYEARRSKRIRRTVEEVMKMKTSAKKRGNLKIER
jgi:hypothetical protein